MTERFATIWAFCWMVLIFLAFAFGLETIPRLLNHSIVAAAVLGTVVGATMVAPIVWVSFRDGR